jgi:hypothetical protein
MHASRNDGVRLIRAEMMVPIKQNIPWDIVEVFGYR